MMPESYDPARDPVSPRQGYTAIEFPTYDTDWDSRGLPDRLGAEHQQLGPRRPTTSSSAVREDGDWDADPPHRRQGRQDAQGARAVGPDRPRRLGLRRSRRAVRHHDQRWHTCPATAAINASNPCSEYMFLDDTACNLASLEPDGFRREDGTFDVDASRTPCRLWTVMLEISVLMAQFPSARIAELSYRLPHARPGLRQPRRLLMALGIPYDSREGRRSAAARSRR